MTKPQILLPDQPITAPDDDVLGYAPFSSHLASSLKNMIPSDGFTIAIYGRWGAGKSSLLNLVENYLKDDKNIVIMRFNPWWFSGHGDLAINFFGELQATLKLTHLTKDLLDLVGKLGDLVSIASVATGPLFPFIQMAIKAAGAVDQVRQERENSVFELKKQIAKILKEQDKRIIVMIDDIDRLIPDEIGHLFRVIKAVADFPKVTYILAFDRDIVTSALHETLNVDGGEYLEKIQ